MNLSKKRENVRRILRKYNILPPYGEETNEKQKEILEQISNNDFLFYTNFKKEKTTQTITYKKRIHKESKRPILKRARITYELRTVGILPKMGEPLNEKQEEILNFVNENYETPIASFITKYRDMVSPEYSIWYRVKRSVKKHKKRKNSEEFFNISVDDIIIPKKCPYLDIELTTNINDCHLANYYTIDRIDNSKGYVKGNIQVISRLANKLKNDATIEQLTTFAKNVIKLHSS